MIYPDDSIFYGHLLRSGWNRTWMAMPIEKGQMIWWKVRAGWAGNLACSGYIAVTSLPPGSWSCNPCSDCSNPTIPAWCSCWRSGSIVRVADWLMALTPW